jgi:NAD(P)-dependent dehydrogenase (short-subunit alcohol dehydrogenase family)
MSSSNVLGPGRVALVTGASRGIGPLIAREIARRGGHVVLTARSAADLKAVASELAAEGADVSFLPADLTQPSAAEALVADIEREHGGVDLLVNNAGGDPLREFHMMTIEERRRGPRRGQHRRPGAHRRDGGLRTRARAGQAAHRRPARIGGHRR